MMFFYVLQVLLMFLFWKVVQTHATPIIKMTIQPLGPVNRQPYQIFL